MPAPVRKIARIAGKPGRAAELRAALLTLETATRAEAGCREFVFYQALSCDDSFVLVEHFDDDAAFRMHLQLPHTQAFFAAQLVDKVQAFDLPPQGES